MSEKRWVLMSDGTPQIFYVGKTELTDSSIEEIIKEGGVVVLEEARAMRTIVIPTPQGVNQSNMLTPISVCRGGVDLHIRPSSWFWPDEDEEGLAALHKQLEQCGSAEIKHRTGIITPDGMKTRGGGRIIQ